VNEGRDLHLLAADASINTAEAAHSAAEQCITKHLKTGGKLEDINDDQETAMHVVARSGSAAMLRAFVGLQVPCKDAAGAGWTALMYVARGACGRLGSAAAVEMLQALLDGPPFLDAAKDDSKGEQKGEFLPTFIHSYMM
jgi:ankyrin repeat protein